MQDQFMLKEVRHQQIYDALRERRAVTVAELVRLVYASPATIRRDLIVLERQGLLSRVYGGAVLVDTVEDEPIQLIRAQQETREKRIIGELASQLLSNNRSVMTDASTTFLSLIPHLAQFSGMTYITNGTKTAQNISELTDGTIYLAPGLYSARTHSTVDAFTTAFLEQWQCDFGFISCRGLHAQQGCTVVNNKQGFIKKVILRKAAIRVLLCDSSKFDAVFLFHAADFNDFDYIISDSLPSGALRAAIDSSAARLVCPQRPL